MTVGIASPGKSRGARGLCPCSRLGAGLLMLAYNAPDEPHVAGVPGVPGVPKPWRARRRANKNRALANKQTIILTIFGMLHSKP
jgi:hypothetical protein